MKHLTLFGVPDLTVEQEKEVLYNHVIAYAASGVSFAKTKGVSAEDYGKYIGNQFTPFWNPEDGFQALVNQLMFILKGMHPNNEMQIAEQSDKMILFKLKNVDAMFKSGPAFGITFKEFLDCSYGIISVLSEHMNTRFSHEMTDDGWYEVTLKSKQ